MPDPTIANYPCLDCRFFFSTQRDLNMHKADMHFLVPCSRCRICDLVFDDKATGLIHVLDKHMEGGAEGFSMTKQELAEKASLDERYPGNIPYGKICSTSRREVYRRAMAASLAKQS